jgi:hypothetical protein
VCLEEIFTLQMNLYSGINRISYLNFFFMPQLAPFHFVNEFTVTVLGLGLLVVLVSYYFLPATMSNHLIRRFFTIL